MVEFIHGVVALLAGLILVLTALVGWLYLQQSRMSHAINALAVAVTAPPPSFMYSSQIPPEQEEQQQFVDDLDDRLSVHDLDASADAFADASADASADAAPSEHLLEQVEDVAAAPAPAPAPEASSSADDDVAGKTVAQLRDMLTAKGIPFNKSDKKSTLVSLVQVSA
uniref:HeH/LEM domain-containing protein n=1 Tax=viral metagenome TaxID=1070528 RepID=A0A6C0HK70_9ZZZZ